MHAVLQLVLMAIGGLGVVAYRAWRAHLDTKVRLRQIDVIGDLPPDHQKEVLISGYYPFYDPEEAPVGTDGRPPRGKGKPREPGAGRLLH